MRNTTLNDVTTMKFMQLCYHCDDAAKCTTEEACRACWALHEEEQDIEMNETQQFLQLQYQ